MYEKIKKTKDNKIKYNELIIFIAIFLIITIPVFWVKDKTDTLSVKILNYYEEKYPNMMRIVANASNLATSLITHFIITIFVFNLSNLFKLIICNLIFFITVALAAILKMIYLKTMLFSLVSNNDFIEPYDCWFTWSCPHTAVVFLAAIFLSLWWMYFPKSLFRAWLRTFFLLIIIFIIAFLSFGIFLNGLISIFDIIFSIILGIMIFIFVFFILKIDCENSKDLKILTEESKAILISNIIIIVTVIILFLTNSKSKQDMNDITNRISYTNCYFLYPENTDPSSDSFILLAIFATNFSMILGIKLEKELLSNNDENKFGFFNFQGDQNELASIYSFQDSLKKAQWNDTSLGKTLLRLLISSVFGILEILLSLLIPYNTSSLFIITIIFKYTLPVLIHTFAIFFLQKMIFIKFDLVNKDAITENTSRNSSLSLNEIPANSLISSNKLTASSASENQNEKQLIS